MSTEQRDNGGPAFPNDYSTTIDLNCGMTLRDYFAAKAMQAYINAYAGGTPDHRDAPEWVPGVAYELADAMLKARQS